MQQAWPGVRFAAGVHPHHAAKVPLADLERVVGEALDLAGAVALGEIGLDYHYDFAPREVQQEVFGRQVAMAVARDLPVVIHTREADADTLRGDRCVRRRARPRGVPLLHGGPGAGRRGRQPRVPRLILGYRDLPACRRVARRGAAGARRPMAGRDRQPVPVAGATPWRAKRAGSGACRCWRRWPAFVSCRSTRPSRRPWPMPRYSSVRVGPNR